MGHGRATGPHLGPLPQLGGTLHLLHQMLWPFKAELSHSSWSPSLASLVHAAFAFPACERLFV